MNILYLHGFASSFDSTSAKVQALTKLGSVSGIDIDYCHRAEEVIEKVSRNLDLEKIDLIVGTSMGGWLSATLGARSHIPFVAINPAISPQITLARHVGEGIDYQGNAFTLTNEIVQSYFPIDQSGRGIVLLDMGDDVINPVETKTLLQKVFPVHCFDGGSHRFEHMNEALDIVTSFYEQI